MNDVDKRSKLVIIVFVFGAELCNGSTADSDSVCEGSNPSSATNVPLDHDPMALLFGVWLSLVECLVRDQEAAGSNPATPTRKRV